ncbi:MAG: alpha/beta hydrolase [Pseudomonadota bacterium]
MPNTPLVIYVPGLMPKPEPATHGDAILRCLNTALARTDSGIQIAPEDFALAAWTFDFYEVHRDFRLDAAAVDAVIAQTEPTEADRAKFSGLTRRAMRWAYRLGDLMPFLIPHLANDRLTLHLRDLRRYVQNTNGAAERAREVVKTLLRDAADRPVLLLAHSMGSVISYEALWQLTHSERNPVPVTLVTMGSPLGQRYIQKRIKGSDKIAKGRYPTKIRHWINVTAVGDLTAIDPCLANDYVDMAELGLIEGIDDREIETWFRLDGVLNVHAEYGYFVTDGVADIVSTWWQLATTAPDSAE